MCNCNKNTGCGGFQNNWNNYECECHTQKKQCGCCQCREKCCPRPEPKCCCCCFEESKGSYNC